MTNPRSKSMVNAEYKVNNVVLTVSYKDVNLDLEKIASELEGARYDPEVFQKLVDPAVGIVLDFQITNQRGLGVM